MDLLILQRNRFDADLDENVALAAPVAIVAPQAARPAAPQPDAAALAALPGPVIEAIARADEARVEAAAQPPPGNPPEAPGGQDEPLPLVAAPHVLAGHYSIHVSQMLKAEGLGSFGMDTPDNRRIALLRAVDIMKVRGLRATHIARSAPMAVALAFTPLPEEVAAAQLAASKSALELLEAKARKWVDPRAVGDLPTVAFN